MRKARRNRGSPRSPPTLCVATRAAARQHSRRGAAAPVVFTTKDPSDVGALRQAISTHAGGNSARAARLGLLRGLGGSPATAFRPGFAAGRWLGLTALAAGRKALARLEG